MNMIFNNTVRRVDYAPTRHGIKVRGKIFEYDLTIATTHSQTAVIYLAGSRSIAIQTFLNNATYTMLGVKSIGTKWWLRSFNGTMARGLSLFISLVYIFALLPRQQ